jgi:hypothetical protein
MNSQIRYADLWALLRRLGYACDRVTDDKRHRICEQAASGSALSLADHPLEQTVHPQTLYGVRLELDNFGLLSREAFDRWVERRTDANAATRGDANGTNKRRKRNKQCRDGRRRRPSKVSVTTEHRSGGRAIANVPARWRLPS